jgi:phosphoribosyl-ATP pyrophosphohydrolase
MTAPWVLVPQQPTEEDKNPRALPVRYDIFVEKLFKYQTPHTMQLHAALGLCEEAGELGGCIKKHAVYNKPLSDPMKEDGKTLKQHIIEEAGDVMFYLQACLNQFNLNFQDVLQYNAIKLSERYHGLSYSDDKANARADKETPEAGKGAQ